MSSVNRLFHRIVLRSTADLPHRVEAGGSAFGSPAWNPEGFAEFVDRIVAARGQGAPVIAFLGSGVLQSGMQPSIIWLMEQGWVTHVATTGAGSEYDVELALLGRTDPIEPISATSSGWGMWKETGDAIHGALSAGWRAGLGYGESVARAMARDAAAFPFRRHSVLYRAYVNRIPCTCHVTIGLDEVHTHPDADFAAIGGASGEDFKIFCDTVTRLENGVFLNVGSSVTGAEVFLKALSIARNLDCTVSRVTTANFDIVRLGDFRKTVGYEDWDYYYRPRKNVVHRPTSLGGRGFHFEGEHSVTVPALCAHLRSRGATPVG